jgi:Ca-activated chloride channel homolog
MFLHVAYPHILYVIAPVFALVLLYRLFWYAYPYYIYPISVIIAKNKEVKKSYHKKILSFLRGGMLILLSFCVARPQWVDERSHVDVEGVDIVLAIDVSGSMQLFDDLKDRRSRIKVAKDEAVRFIGKRINDPIGIVFFGKEALSRCPLTLDKNFLKEIVAQLELGVIDPNGTWLGTGLATAISRLKNSKAKNRVVILLTDGAPTPPEKIDPDIAIELACQFGVKVYTVGIGNKEGGYISHPMFGLQQTDVNLNVSLLQKIAQKTGGVFFQANNPRDMRTIYDKIDLLEKTKYQTNLFHRYYEAFLSFIWLLLLLVCVELFLRLFIWRGV